MGGEIPNPHSNAGAELWLLSHFNTFKIVTIRAEKTGGAFNNDDSDESERRRCDGVNMDLTEAGSCVYKAVVYRNQVIRGPLFYITPPASVSRFLILFSSQKNGVVLT